DASAGTGTVNIDTATFTDPVVIAGGVINDNLGTDINAGTNSVTLIGTVAPGQSPGILVVTGNFAFANNDTFDVEIGGTSPGNTATDHDQIDVTGTVTIGTGVTLNTSSFGGFTPLEGQQYVIINNDGTDAVSGTFAGLPEGAIITNFLGSGLDAVISYLGSDAATGNDVVLSVGSVIQQVVIDVKPDSETNTVNLAANGVLPVVIYTTADFDASTVVVGTVTFAGAYVVQSALEDVDGDGDLDLVLHFRIQEMVDLESDYRDALAADLADNGFLDDNHQEVTVTLKGSTIDGTLIEGSDIIDAFFAGKALKEALSSL
ncbi:MAG: hypothetical protein IH899_05805, partial [Planctomycetes bacterium]|nr:hypothetical protein [Planctomycetota bacterium]